MLVVHGIDDDDEEDEEVVTKVMADFRAAGSLYLLGPIGPKFTPSYGLLLL